MNTPGTSLCSLTDETRIPKFFRVTEQVFPFPSSFQPFPTSQDSDHFPRATFTSLSLVSAEPSNKTSEVETKASNIIVVKFSIELEFYYNEFDWGLIYRCRVVHFVPAGENIERRKSNQLMCRQIGAEGGKGNNMFYKVVH